MSEHDQTQRYYDGELAGDAEAAALAHLASCARCQRELGEWMALDGALADAPKVPVAAPAPAPARGRRAWWLAAPALAMAAAIAIYVVARPGRRPAAPPALALALADTRGVEVRVSAPALDRHRPLRIDRGSAPGEVLPLAAVAALEARDPAAYAGALVLGGELRRARAALEALPPSPAREADRAALALLAGDPAQALEAAARALAAGPSPVARWNRALALRELGATRGALAELDAIAAAGEPGWSDEARAISAGLRGPFLEREAAFAAFSAAGTAMATGGPAIATDDAARFPGLARLYLHDALRGAASAAEASTLAPVAAAIDRATGGDGAGRAVAATAAADFTVRARFSPRYRALVAGALDPAQVPGFLAELARAGAPVADLRLGAIIVSGQATARAAELDALARATGDPWFTLYADREQARRQRAADDLAGAEATLRVATAACPPSVAYRCGALELELAQIYVEVQRAAEGAARARKALDAYRASGTPSLETFVLVTLGDAERQRARFAAMRAYQDEYRRSRPDDCATGVFVDEGLALAAYWQGDVAAARAALPAVDACGGAPSAAHVMVAVDVARFTGEPADLAHARAAIAALRASGTAASDPAVRLEADAGEGRLAIVGDPPGGRALLRRAIAAAADVPARDVNRTEFRTWAYSSLIGDAAARGDHPGALADFFDELGGGDPGGCVLALSLDDDRAAVVVRGAGGAVTGATTRTTAIGRATADELVGPAQRDALAGCAEVGVIARPPLHGRTDLLPAQVPWAFLGNRRAAPAAPAAPGARAAVIVRDARPPADLGLPRVGGQAVEATGDRVLAGADATPARVVAALEGAGYAELHVHGLVDLGLADASLLALSPDPSGRFALTAGDVARTTLTGAPVVVLAACRSAEVLPVIGKRWSLPDAFVAAGARAVIAAAVPIPDDGAAAFSAALRRRLAAGESPAAAVAAERSAPGAAPWLRQVIVFR